MNFSDRKLAQKHRKTLNQADRKKSLQLYKTFQKVLFQNHLKYKGNHIDHKFWGQEISSSCIGYARYIEIVIDSVVTILPALSYIDTLEILRKKYWVCILRLSRRDESGASVGHHFNAFIYADNEYYYIEPNGGSGNIYTTDDVFQTMWEQIISHIQTRLDRCIRLVKLPVRSPVFLLDDEYSRFSFRAFQPIVQSTNQQSRGEQGGYCVSVTLFILQLFRENCLETEYGCDTNITPWTPERFRMMLDTYLLISIGTGQIHSDLRGFNVAVMYRLGALKQLQRRRRTYGEDTKREVSKQSMLKHVNSYSKQVIDRLDPQDTRKKRRIQQITDEYRQRIESLYWWDLNMTTYKKIMSQLKDRLFCLPLQQKIREMIQSQTLTLDGVSALEQYVEDSSIRLNIKKKLLNRIFVQACRETLDHYVSLVLCADLSQLHRTTDVMNPKLIHYLQQNLNNYEKALKTLHPLVETLTIKQQCTATLNTVIPALRQIIENGKRNKQQVNRSRVSSIVQK